MAYYLSRNPRHTVIGAIRGLFRLLYFAAVFAFVALEALALRVVLPTRTYARLRPKITRRLSRVLVVASNIRVRTEGTPPPRGTLIVANHVSWADSITFLSELGCRFMANHLYGEIVGFGSILKAAGVAFMNRMSVRAVGHAQAVLRTLLEAGDSVLVFPEGRTSRGETVRPFRTALMQVAVDLKIPVSWATVSYETPPDWPPASVVVGWEEWPPLITHIYRAFHSPRIVCRIRFGEEPVSAPDRRTLAWTLHDVVSRRHRSMRQLPAAALRKIDVVKKVARQIVWGRDAK